MNDKSNKDRNLIFLGANENPLVERDILWRISFLRLQSFIWRT